MMPLFSSVLAIRKVGFCLVVLLLIGCQGENQSYDWQGDDWEVYKADARSSSYSGVDQINKDNVDQLEVAWTYRTGDLTEDPEDHPRTGIETNPIIVDDVMYAVSPHLKVAAVDAATGEERWVFDPFSEAEKSSGKLRSVVYWEDGSDKRILFTAGNWLHALDAETGTLIPRFGQQGRVSLNEGLGRKPDKLNVRSSSPGIIYQDRLILGSTVGADTIPGHIRAYDVRTGEKAWTFHTIPQRGEPGFDTWEGMDEATLRRRGGANNWAGMSLDKERGIVYAPLGAPNYDFYGGERPGKNLYANSLVALDAGTGDYIWHYQVVHHDVWDYDLPAPPNLVTVEKGGEEIDAVAQITKHGFTFVFDRATGEPVFPIEEKPVPPSNVVGEQAWPTQPFPTKPEPFARQSLTVDQVTDLTPAARDSVLTKLEGHRNEGLFTPPGTRGSIVLPGTRGAGRWGGAAHDPDLGILYVNASELPQISTVQQVETASSPSESLYDQGRDFYVQNCASCHGMDREGRPPTYPALRSIEGRWSRAEVLRSIKRGGSMMPAFSTITEEEEEAILAYLFEQRERLEQREDRAEGQDASGEDSGSSTGNYIDVTSHKRLDGPKGYPGIKPPWGTLNAIDLNTGEMKWKVPLGTYPELMERGIPPTGTPSMGGPIATAGGLVFIGGTADKKFRAFDKETGELLWETTLPAAGFATPATYTSGGRQYVVIAAGGGRGTKPGDYYVAFALPE